MKTAKEFLIEYRNTYGHDLVHGFSFEQIITIMDLFSSQSDRTVTDKEAFYKYGESLGIKINDLQRLRSLLSPYQGIKVKEISEEQIEKEAKMRATNNIGFYDSTKSKWFRSGAKWALSLLSEGKEPEKQDDILKKSLKAMDDYLKNTPKEEIQKALDEMGDYEGVTVDEFIKLGFGFNPLSGKESKKPLSEPMYSRKQMIDLYEGTLQNVGTCIKKDQMPTAEQALSMKQFQPVYFSPNTEQSNKEVKSEEWISVEERLPERHESVLVMIDKRIEIKIYGYHSAGSYTNFSEKEFFEKITHWMPLPKMLSTEKKEGRKDEL